MSTRNLRVDGDRLWASLMEMARIGATEKGGVCRVALTDLDRQGRDLFRRWCEEAGCTVRVDPMGNMFARRPGRDPSRDPVGTGSHLDSQPTGGKFDGVYGVLAGLEVVRTLNDRGIETEAPVELCVWTNEEGARFPPAMVGSGVFAGVFSLDYGHSRADHDGKTQGEELARIGYLGDAPLGHAFGAYFEAHIEQGPILENAGKTIGIVTGAQGTRWYDVILTGAESHAGPTPMELRRDAMAGAGEILAALYRIALDRPPHGRATVGEFRLHPGSRNTVPGRIEFSVDLRHPDGPTLESMDADLKALVARVAAARGLEHEVVDIWLSPPVAFDAGCVDAVRKGAAALGHEAMEVVSGAGHDSVYLSRVAPTGMVFIPCEGGISHNEVENATPADVTAGCDVLLHAMLDRAGVVA
ncbi:MAG: Zn-dependent hydrolase [Ectothiorhodospiraceae bacterium]|nr:Zn-dependent hydrolase [Chromatiales bacterium]MCP5153804.1 Zn-dependent hydrolase [Ectothiorhodospiraceae bacterium]